MAKQIKININDNDNNFNIKSEIENFIKNIDWENEETKIFNLIFVENDKDVTNDWKKSESYQTIKKTLDTIISSQEKHFKLSKKAFKNFKEKFEEMIKENTNE